MNNLKFSLITPTHKENPYLLELFDSIVAQTHSNWEWVLWLNGSVTKSGLPDSILSFAEKNEDKPTILSKVNCVFILYI